MINEILLIISLAFIMELIDSSLGLGYGTILSPLFIIIFENEPSVVIPSILLSQTISGSLAGFFHNRFENVSFKMKKYSWIENIKKGFTIDLRIVFLISFFGILFTIIGAFLTLHIPLIILKVYISLSVFWIGILIFTKKQFIFSWKKIFLFGAIATFNKGFMGGGFGPILTGGQILSGQKEKSAIGCTTLAEGPVCLTGFFAYLVMNNIQGSILNFLIPMLIGSCLAAPFGAIITKKINHKMLRHTVSFLMILLGIGTFIKIWI